MKKLFILCSILMLSLFLPCKVQADEGEPIDEFVYLTKCVQAEAGNQDFRGKRLVAAVILNRVASEKFPNSIVEVINAPRQFAVVANKSINTVEVDQETINACRMELAHRSDTDILYFNNSSQVSGKFCYKYGGHWFGR